MSNDELHRYIPGKIKTYDDLAREIVARIQFATVNNLPREFFDALGDYAGSHQSYLPFGRADYHGINVRAEWYPAGQQFHLVFHYQGGILARFTFEPPKPD